jgi:hypothetical protein
VARRREIRLPADWFGGSPAVAQLSLAELGLLLRLIAEARMWYPDGRFVRDGKPVSLRALADGLRSRGGGAIGCLHGLVSAGLLVRHPDGALALVEAWRADGVGEDLDEPVLSKVPKESPLSPITPIPQENTKRETWPPPVSISTSLPADLAAVPALLPVWADWISHIRDLHRLSGVKLSQDVESLRSMLRNLGPEKTVQRLKECISQGFSAIGPPKSYSKPPAYNQHSPTRPGGPDSGKLTKDNFLPKYE